MLNKPINWIAPDQLQRWLKDGKSAVIIDVLPEEVFRQRHLPGAENACVYEVAFPDRVKALAPGTDQAIVLYGASKASQDAVTAAEKLQRLGYRKVRVLDGGAAAWHERGHPLEGSDIERAARVDNLLKLKDGVYQVDMNRSVIEWTGRNANKTHFGRVRLLRGEIRVKNMALSGDFGIDMTSIENIDLAGDESQPVLISHLMSDDFFFVKLFPAAAFTITVSRPLTPAPLSAPNYEIEGTLELRGMRQALHFPATLSRLSETQIAAEAHFDFDRTRWNVIYGSSRFFECLGMHLVFDPVSIELRLVAVA